MAERNGARETMTILDITDLTVTYGTANRRHTAVDTASIAVKRGELVALVGESGSGKSTLARAVAGIHAPATIRNGSIRLDSEELADADTETWRTVRGSRIGFAFQDPTTAFDPVYSIGEQLCEAIRAAEGTACSDSPFETLSGLLHRRSDQQHREQARSLLAEVGIEDLGACLGAYPSELSGGQCQRAFLATALAGDPDLLIADEPTSGLDAATRARVLSLLEELAATRELGVLLITHDLGLVSEHCDRINILADGRIVDGGPTSSVLARPGHEVTRELVSAAHSLTPSDREPVAADGSQATEHRPTTDETLVSLRGLTKRYSVDDSVTARLFNDRAYLTALDDISLDVQAGETLGIIGPSGSGKSTVIECIAGLTEPTAGRVFLDGDSVGPVGTRDTETLNDVGVVFQQPTSSLDPRWTLSRSIAEPLARRGWSTGDIEDRVSGLCSTVGITQSVAASRPGAVSGGQAQRAALARALAHSPKLLLLDEPVSALDATTRASVVSLLEKLQSDPEGPDSSVLVSHDLRTVGQLADRLVVLEDGAVVERGPAEQILSAPDHPQTCELLEAVPELPSEQVAP